MVVNIAKLSLTIGLMRHFFKYHRRHKVSKETLSMGVRYMGSETMRFSTEKKSQFISEMLRKNTHGY